MQKYPTAYYDGLMLFASSEEVVLVTQAKMFNDVG